MNLIMLTAVTLQTLSTQLNKIFNKGLVVLRHSNVTYCITSLSSQSFLKK